MSTTATAELDRHQLLSALKAFRRGDFSVRLPEIFGDIATTFNEIVDLNDQMTREFSRLGHVVGKEGRIDVRGQVHGAMGGWETSVRAINDLIQDMVQPTAEVSRVIGAVAKGDLSQSMMVEIDGRPLRGEFLRIGKVGNTMVEQLASFASEVTRVAREVGTEGKLGGLNLIERKSQPSPELARLIEMTRRAAEQGTDLIKRLLAFSRKQELNPETIDLQSVEKTTLDLLTHTLGGLVEISWTNVSDAWQVFADRNQLELAIVNLAVNARDVMPDDGYADLKLLDERPADVNVLTKPICENELLNALAASQAIAAENEGLLSISTSCASGTGRRLPRRRWCRPRR